MTTSIVIICIIILDLVTVWGVKRGFPQFSSRYGKSIQTVFIIQAVLAIVIVLFGQFQRYIGDYRIIALSYYFFGGMTALYIPKLVFSCFLIVCKAVRKHNKFAKYGFWISATFALLVVWGVLFGRYDFKVEHVEIKSDIIPQSFDGYRIMQLSDIHAGSFAGIAHRFQKAVDLANEQKPDIIVMTGDIVNNYAEELIPFIPIFSQLSAADGKFAVLGNHDYGGYFKWKSPIDSVTNHKNIKSNIELMGFVFLDNEAIVIKRNEYDSIALIGVENWGVLKRFPKRADVQKAMENVRDIPFKVLITHDPSLWTRDIKNLKDVTVTLAGHTHGGQMGVKIGKKRMGPAILLPRFRYWAGLYKYGEQYLYINRGLGVIGFPARIGMPPEITVITLRNI